MDKNYYRYKWADAEIMKKDKQNPLRKDVAIQEKKQYQNLTRLLDNINKL